MYVEERASGWGGSHIGLLARLLQHLLAEARTDKPLATTHATIKVACPFRVRHWCSAFNRVCFQQSRFVPTPNP